MDGICDLLDYEPPWGFGVLHGFAVEFFGFLELQSEIDETEWWDDAQSETYSPCCAEMVIPAGQYHDHGYQG